MYPCYNTVRTGGGSLSACTVLPEGSVMSKELVLDTGAPQGCVLSQVLPRGCVLSQVLPRGVFCHRCSPGCVLSQVLPRGVFCHRCSPGVCFVPSSFFSIYK